MIAAIAGARRPASGERPTFQWDPSREPGSGTLRLYGCLGERELRRVLDTVVERARSPRESVVIDFTGVEHIDFRAVADFLRALGRLRDRCASVWLVGASTYIQQLMDVSGQGSLRQALSWAGGPAGCAARTGGYQLRSPERRALRAGVWN